MRLVVAPLLWLQLGCATPAAAARGGRLTPAAEPVFVGERVAAAAAEWVGRSSLRAVDAGVPDDCTGLVRLAYAAIGVELRGSAATMYAQARRVGAIHRGPPRRGDLVFFRETYDRNGDGRRNDGITHVGVVELVDASGTVTFVHRGSRGVARAKMNLRRPFTREWKGEVVNDWLRPGSRKQRPRLNGELFVGYASAEKLVGGTRRSARR
ncbi:MAG: NlpC/P60 family protein [Myxococcota bacterium]